MKPSSNCAICPGTFDPITSGHLDVIQRASPFFDRFIVAVAYNPAKNPLFPLNKRIELIEKSTRHLKNIEATGFEGLLVDKAKELGANVIVKGLRAISDFEYEFQMAQINIKLEPEIETFFVMASPEYSFLSSSAVRELAFFGACTKGLIPEAIEGDILDIFSRATRGVQD